MPQALFPLTPHLSVRPISRRAAVPYITQSEARAKDKLLWALGIDTDMFRLDYLSCCLTILSTVLLGKRLWHGWIVAGVNSVILCIIGMRTAQFGFVPANLFCIGLYANNLWNWRPKTAKPQQIAELARQQAG